MNYIKRRVLLTKALEFKRYKLAVKLLKLRFSPHDQFKLLKQAEEDAKTDNEAKAFLDLYNLNKELYGRLASGYIDSTFRELLSVYDFENYFVNLDGSKG